METFVEKTHSGLGISSFILSISTGILIFFLIIVAGVMESTTPGGMDEESVGAVLVGLFLFAFIFLDLLALGLGIAGLVQKDRKKVFAVLGVIFSASIFFITVFILTLGLMLG